MPSYPLSPLHTEHTLRAQTKQTHTHNLQSVKYLPTVQKCGSSICFAKVSLLPIAGHTETRAEQTRHLRYGLCVYL